MEATKQKIRALLKEKKAILLAHNYVLPEVQDVADLCGDSLELSIKAAATDAEVIVFCGVHFMAETASILSPDKTVLLPVKEAGCPMADMVTPEALAARKAELPGVPVVTYVNSSAAVKALSDVCCTSANVVKVVASLKEKEVLMTPDRNLAQYAASKTDKTVHLWEGYCPFHNTLTAKTALAVKAKHPGAVFMAHPECPPEVLEVADVVTSTSGMLTYAKESPATTFIVGTEVGILYPLSQQNPEKTFIPASLEMTCADMKRIRLDDIVACLETLSGVVKVPEEIRVPALSAVEKMIAMK
ncbi:quinolinate synthase NadA [Desulfoluna spongiiphila]|uniref:quinolinate synthase NadA n=1 Tax=Desulfoluna spongiiphila TaxID=419481 RepID=UPI001257D6FF|nr:quinolinate synthase NadA [Desulfoluna spongiiphila]VVS93046.1 quinolinate synthetase a [Desulfoluna spongiiphila]